MVAMTLSDQWAEQDRLLTIDDLDDLPNTQLRYELDDGALVVSPAPANRHQFVVGRLSAILIAACPDDLAVFPAPGMSVSNVQYRIPDVAVATAKALPDVRLDRPPLLAVEVSSGSTRLYDRNRKKDVYEGFGIPSYWIVEPDRDRPRLIVFELRDGKYEQVAEVTGDEQFRAVHPFPVTISPSALVRTGPLD
jgi:Uma2 family endonuclease